MAVPLPSLLPLWDTEGDAGSCVIPPDLLIIIKVLVLPPLMVVLSGVGMGGTPEWSQKLREAGRSFP